MNCYCEEYKNIIKNEPNDFVFDKSFFLNAKNIEYEKCCLICDNSIFHTHGEMLGYHGITLECCSCKNFMYFLNEDEVQSVYKYEFKKDNLFLIVKNKKIALYDDKADDVIFEMQETEPLNKNNYVQIIEKMSKLAIFK